MRIRTTLVIVGLLLVNVGYAQDGSKLLLHRPQVDHRGQQIKILDAIYGQDERTCNAYRAVADVCEGQHACVVDADDNLCGNPYHNVRKDLFIAYQCGDGRRTLTVSQGNPAHVYCADSQGSAQAPGYGGDPRPPQGWRQNLIIVQQAAYGIPGAACDATARFANECDDRQSCSMRVDNGLCGDPARGERKSAEVAYWCNGRLERVSGREQQVISLNCR
jgi:hypothetical protein